MAANSLGTSSWPAVRTGPTVVVAVGSTEQHGPHLPLDTDTRIADAVARTVPEVLLAPPIAYGASGEHEAFPGTVSIGSEALTLLLVEFGRSICNWAKRVLFVNGHGGNGQALVDAVTLLRYEGRDVAWFPCSFPDADAHAGRTETSVLLYLSPEVVDMSRAEPGNVTPVAKLLPELRIGGVAPLSPNGVLGDPTTSTAAEGEQLFTELCARAADAVHRWSPSEQGLLR